MRKDDEELWDSLDLEFLLDRQSVRFRRSRGQSGMQLNLAECPACGDKRYRTYLNADSGFGNCFVCNETFNKPKFVHYMLGHDPESKIDWRATFQFVKEVLKEQGWRPKRMTTAAVEIGDIELPKSIELPTKDGQNAIYLEQRGINGDLARFFRLRYCIAGRWNFTREDGTPGWQEFGGRIIIPVFDLDGTLKTFQGRDIIGNSDKKYLFPSGLPGTGRYLLNGHNAAGCKRVCMGEGFFDVAAIKIAMDEENELRDVMAIGSFGKQLSCRSDDGNDQLGRFIELKSHGLKEVTIMWDGEPKALLSAFKAAKELVRVGLRVRIALLPKDKDPNEVAPIVVREAFWGARLYTPALELELTLRNPYGTA